MDVRLFIAFMLSLLATPDGAPPPASACAAWLAAILIGLALYGFAASRVLAFLVRRSADPQAVTRRHGLLMRFYGLLWLGAYAAFLFLLRWPSFTDSRVRTDLVLLEYGLVLLPLLLILPVVWCGAFFCGRVVRQVPGAWPLPAGQDTLSHYLFFQFRQNLLILLVPYVFVLGSRDVAYLASGRRPDSLPTEASWFVALAIIYVFSPVMLRFLWPTHRLPPGPLRDRLELLARHAGVRIADIFVWRTGRFLVNASMAGVVPPVRYVFLSESLLEGFHPAQVEAIFGHELGHARYHHIAFYFLVAAAGALLLLLLTPWLDYLGPAQNYVAGAVFIAYWGGLFGFLSRRFERQCDLAGARLASCPGETTPDSCAYHAPPTPGQPFATPDPYLICPLQAWAFNSALERLAAINGVSPNARAWRHGSIASRTDFVARMIGRPDLARRYDLWMRRFKLAFVGCVFVLAVLAAVIWWQWRPF